VNLVVDFAFSINDIVYFAYSATYVPAPPLSVQKSVDIWRARGKYKIGHAGAERARRKRTLARLRRFHVDVGMSDWCCFNSKQTCHSSFFVVLWVTLFHEALLNGCIVG